MLQSLDFLNNFLFSGGKVFFENLNDILVTLNLFYCKDFLPVLLLFYPEVRNFEAVSIYFEWEKLIERLLRLEYKIRWFFEFFESGWDALLTLFGHHDISLLLKKVISLAFVNFIFKVINKLLSHFGLRLHENFGFVFQSYNFLLNKVGIFLRQNLFKRWKSVQECQLSLLILYLGSSVRRQKFLIYHYRTMRLGGDDFCHLGNFNVGWCLLSLYRIDVWPDLHDRVTKLMQVFRANYRFLPG